jgi:F420H(2)-dependent quinone reductase
VSGYVGAVATGHRGFAVLNRAVNPLVGSLLRSPLHRLASRRLALITYTGRRTGRRHTIPVGYEMAGLEVTIAVGAPERKVWWRSLTGAGAAVELVVRGRRLTGHAVATRAGDQALVTVALDR